MMSTFILLAVVWCDTMAQPDSLRISSPDTSVVRQDTRVDTTMELARRALLKSMVQPGWGQLQNGRIVKAVLFAGIEVGMFYAIFHQHTRWQELKQDALETSDPLLQYDYERRSRFYLNDRNKLLWWLLWFELFNITDAYVDAALADFDDSPDLSLQLLPEGFAVTVSLKLPFWN